MFRWPKRRSRKSEPCSSHGNLTEEEWRAEALRHGNLLREALDAAIEITQEEPLLNLIVTQATIAHALIGMEEISAAYVVFPKTDKPGVRTLGFTWEWIADHDRFAAAEDILSQIREAIAEGNMSDSPDDYLPKN